MTCTHHLNWLLPSDNLPWENEIKRINSKDMATFAAYNCNAKVLHVDGEFVIQ